jgi:hypothetical protein
LEKRGESHKVFLGKKSDPYAKTIFANKVKQV